jgi:hypothetical protein
MDCPSEDAFVSAETLLAVRRYHQEMASYTLQQWNVAKLESEKKERERRRKRANVLVQRQQVMTGAGTGHSNGAGTVNDSQVNAPRPTAPALNSGVRPSDGHRPNSDGPLMMISRRKSDREKGGMPGGTSSAPSQSGYRPSRDHQRYEYAKRAHSIHNDIERLNQMVSPRLFSNP